MIRKTRRGGFVFVIAGKATSLRDFRKLLHPSFNSYGPVEKKRTRK